MNPITDIVVASVERFDAILSDVNNALELDTTVNAGVSIDDVISILSVHRGVRDDRQAWWKIRREAYARFASHPSITTRTLAAIPASMCNEISALQETDLESIAPDWVTAEDSTPADREQAMRSLTALLDACSRAGSQGLTVMLRTNQPANDFELAFQKLDGKPLRNFQKAFDSWDDVKRHEAHQRYNYYLKQGQSDCLNQVLRDFTRPKTIRISLKTDQGKVKRHVTKAIKAYLKNPAPERGEPDDPVTMITLTFDVEYEGYVDLSFHTVPNAIEDISWEERTELCLEFPRWHEGVERLACDELPLKLTLQDGTKVVIDPDGDDDEFDNHIGNMLRDAMVSLRDTGEFERLPLASGCVMWVGGTHTNYAWPEEDRLAQDGYVSLPDEKSGP